MDNSYVSVEGGSYRITGTRVSLDSVVYDYLSGLSPESIADNFDTMSLEQVYGAITSRPTLNSKSRQIRRVAKAGARI